MLLIKKKLPTALLLCPLSLLPTPLLGERVYITHPYSLDAVSVELDEDRDEVHSLITRAAVLGYLAGSLSFEIGVSIKTDVAEYAVELAKKTKTLPIDRAKDLINGKIARFQKQIKELTTP